MQMERDEMELVAAVMVVRHVVAWVRPRYGGWLTIRYPCGLSRIGRYLQLSPRGTLKVSAAR